MTNALICCDSFKGSLTSQEINSEIASLFERFKIKTDTMEVSDGGEGFLDVLSSILDSSKTITVETIDQKGNEIKVEVLVVNKTVYIESAKVVGLNLIPIQMRKILSLSTKGLGILVKNLFNQGIKKFVIGLGGTGTNDYGIGFLQGLGYKFLDNKKRVINNPLSKIEKVKAIQPVETYQNISFLLVSDVISPAVGELGAAKLFAKQKNASDHEILILENSALKYLKLLKEFNYSINSENQFLGAAGGIGLSLKAFFNCKFIRGAKFILDLNNFEKLKNKYTYIITGEGKFDIQSLQGKIVGEILEQVESNKKIIVFTGVFDFDEQEYLKLIHRKNLSVYSCLDKNSQKSNFMNKNIALQNLRNAVLKFLTEETEQND